MGPGGLAGIGDFFPMIPIRLVPGEVCFLSWEPWGAQMSHCHLAFGLSH